MGTKNKNPTELSMLLQNEPIIIHAIEILKTDFQNYLRTLENYLKDTQNDLLSYKE